ncbi:MAG TPA: MFS transporter, partial [Chloroflexota bacterium]|nr:MFS transporter [Chloroflexota bacterium]
PAISAADSRPNTSGAEFMRDRATWAAYLLVGLFSYIQTSIGPAMPFLRDRLDLGYIGASIRFSAIAAASAVVGATGEHLVGRLGRSRAQWGGMTGMATGVALVGLAPHIVISLLGALMIGGLGTLALIANQAALADLHGPRREVALTESNVVATSTAIMAPLLIGASAAVGLGWQAGLLLPLPWLLLLAWRFRGVGFPDVPSVELGAVGQAKRLPATFWLLCVVIFLLSAVEWCMAYWGADFLDTVVGLDKAAAAAAMTLFFVAMAGGRFVGSRLTRRRRSVTLLPGAVVLGLAGFLVFWLAPYPVMNLAGLFFAGLGIANFYPLTVAAATSAAVGAANRATARLAVAVGLALLLVPLSVGVVSDLADLRWGFGLVVQLMLGALAALGLAARAR